MQLDKSQVSIDGLRVTNYSQIHLYAFSVMVHILKNCAVQHSIVTPFVSVRCYCVKSDRTLEKA